MDDFICSDAFFFKISLAEAEISQFLIKEVEKEDTFGNNNFSMDDTNTRNDKDEEDPLLSGYDLFDYDKSDKSVF